MKSILSIVVLLAVVYTASAIVCRKNFCDAVRCSNAMAKADCEQNLNGVYTEHGGLCGCCPACLTKINEGEKCLGLLIQLRGLPPRAVCAPGLTCDSKTEKCVKIE